MTEKPNSHWHTERRDKMAADGFKTLLLLNGGGAVVLLAFLQAIWGKPLTAPLIPWIIGGLCVLALGALTAGALHFLRMHTSWAHQTAGLSGRCAQRLETGAMVLALFFFATGIGIIAWGASENLPSTSSPHSISPAGKTPANQQN